MLSISAHNYTHKNYSPCKHSLLNFTDIPQSFSSRNQFSQYGLRISYNFDHSSFYNLHHYFYCRFSVKIYFYQDSPSQQVSYSSKLLIIGILLSIIGLKACCFLIRISVDCPRFIKGFNIIIFWML